jgi:hypothetical protein
MSDHPKYGTYVMPRGSKHAGRTLAQIEQGGDHDYIVWSAQEYPNAKIRRACAAYLESTEAGREPADAVTIPLPVAASTDLSAGAKLLFGVIYTAADQDPDRLCRLGNAELQARTGLSAGQVRRLLPELEAMGLIQRSLCDAGHRAGIVPTWHPGWSHGVPGSAICAPSARANCAPWEGPDLVATRLKQVDETRKPIRWRGRPYERDGQAVMRHRRDRRLGVPSDGYASPGPKGDE